MLDTDNQQATGWFVGVLEGRGYFQNTVTISYDDLEIIVECEKYLTSQSINFDRREVKVGKKRTYYIDISYQQMVNSIDVELQCRRLGASEILRDLTINIDWLIGIFEVAGSFLIYRNHEQRLTPKIDLESTHRRVIDRAVLNLQALGLPCYVKHFDPEKSKPYTRVTLQGMKRCERFLMQITGWRSKAITLKTRDMLLFCQSRLGNPVRDPYTVEEIGWANNLRYLNSQ